MKKLGTPKLVNNDTDYSKFGVSVMIDNTEIELANLFSFDLDLKVDDNPMLTIKFAHPQVDLKIGNYHITSTWPKPGHGLPLYHIVDLRSGEEVHCQQLKFDGNNLSIGFGSDQLHLDKKALAHD